MNKLGAQKDIYVKKSALETYQNLPIYLYFHGGAFLAGPGEFGSILSPHSIQTMTRKKDPMVKLTVHL